MNNGLQESRDHVPSNMSFGAALDQRSSSPTPSNDPGLITHSLQHMRLSVIFNPVTQVHRYLPAVQEDEGGVDDDDEWDVGSYEDEDVSLAEAVLADHERPGGSHPDDGISWEETIPGLSRADGHVE